jgi:CheY-like chemotaxis protein
MEAAEAGNAAQALEALRAAAGAGRPFDLAVLDLQMPGMDGLQLVRAIRADRMFSSTRLVMLTSVGLRGQAETLHRAGAAGFLTKPVRESQLYDCLATVVQTPQAAPAASAATGRPPAPLVTRHSVKEARDRRRPAVLVVDDNETNQMVAVRMLGHLGCRADVAANGLEAVEAVARVPYAMVLMDCQMPEMDGYEATRVIRGREDGSRPPLPIVAMTAHAMKGDRDKCLAAGMNDYLAKPVTMEGLGAAVSRWLRPRGGTARRGQKEKMTRDGGISRRGEAGAGSETGGRAARPARRRGPVLDPAAWKSLRAVQESGHDGFITELIDKFLAEAPARLATLRQAAARGDTDPFIRAAHSLKGSAGVVGAKTMSARCQALEERARGGSMDAVAEDLEALDEDYRSVAAALAAERARVSPRRRRIA